MKEQPHGGTASAAFDDRTDEALDVCLVLVLGLPVSTEGASDL